VVDGFSALAGASGVFGTGGVIPVADTGGCGCGTGDGKQRVYRSATSSKFKM